MLVTWLFKHVTNHLGQLNLQLQSRNQRVNRDGGDIKSFNVNVRTLEVWSKHWESVTLFGTLKFAYKISDQLRKLKLCFADFGAISVSYSLEIECIPEQPQKELAEL